MTAQGIESTAERALRQAVMDPDLSFVFDGENAAPEDADETVPNLADEPGAIFDHLHDRAPLSFRFDAPW